MEGDTISHFYYYLLFSWSSCKYLSIFEFGVWRPFSLRESPTTVRLGLAQEQEGLQFAVEGDWRTDAQN